MLIHEFLARHGALPDQISPEESLTALLTGMELGLKGEGNIPMLPSFLSVPAAVEPGAACCVLDAGGTNLRTARAVKTVSGWRLEGLARRSMPGTEGEVSCAGLYGALAAPVRDLGNFEKVGFCFSYNVTMDRSLDGKLDCWCKEVRAPEAVGQPVGSSLKAALGEECKSVRVLNDSVAAMLGAGDVQVGAILGTGINVCYLEQCRDIPKVPGNLKSDSMIISTEIGEFAGFPKSDFEAAVIAASDEPGSAHAEKQCAGGYLGDVISAIWSAAAEAGILPADFRNRGSDLVFVSRALTGEETLPEAAAELARQAISRAARIAAVLCAGPILKAARSRDTVRMAVEGSQYWRLTGFREAFHGCLEELLRPRGIRCEIVRQENACLIGAALAAFAEEM